MQDQIDRQLVEQKRCPGRRTRAARALGVIFLSFALTAPTTSQAASQYSGRHLVPKFAAAPPKGAIDLCNRYSWACSPRKGAAPLSKEALTLARQINTRVNRDVRQISDSRQFGRSEYWTLPTNIGGDCEDLALLKKAQLLQRGVPPEMLLIATVLDRQGQNHAVLVIRTSAGDYVLDSLTNQIRLWSETRYSFLRIQDPNAPRKWRF